MRTILICLILICCRPVYADVNWEVCLDCTEQQAIDQATEIILQQNAEEPDEGLPSMYAATFNIFTDSGSDKGYSIFATLFRNRLNVRTITSTNEAIDYYSEMSNIRTEYGQLITNVQNEIDNVFMERNGFSISKISPTLSSLGDEPTGECTSLLRSSSPFQYFTGNTRLEIDADHRRFLSAHSPGLTAAIQGLGITISADPGAVLDVIFQSESDPLTEHFGNGGRLVFNIAYDAQSNSFFSVLNLDVSTLGMGLSRDPSAAPDGPSLSQFIYRDSDGNYQVKNGDYEFENNCVEADWNDLLELMGLDIDLSGLPEQINSPLEPLCATPTTSQFNREWTWQEFVTTYRVVGRTVYITGRFVPRTISFDLYDDNPCP